MRAFGLNRCPNGGAKKKNTQKRSKKRSAGAQGKPTVGLWVPLRTRKQDIRTSENQETGEMDQTRPDVPKGTVADFVNIKMLELMLCF